MKTLRQATFQLLSDLKAGREQNAAFSDAISGLDRYGVDVLNLCRDQKNGAVTLKYVEMQAREMIEYIVILHMPNGDDVRTRYKNRFRDSAFQQLDDYLLAGKSASLTAE
ncbi:hypothetical protein J4Z08_23015 [Citrobacter portucalensis]|uniref:hypothetical protein n=1 Tax=Citrobacter portucalensis TaxID=1639133 RepID=UPI003140208B